MSVYQTDTSIFYVISNTNFKDRIRFRIRKGNDRKTVHTYYLNIPQWKEFRPIKTLVCFNTHIEILPRAK